MNDIGDHSSASTRGAGKMKSLRCILLSLAFLSLCFSATAATRISGGPIVGRVINAETGQPLANVFVIAEWDVDIAGIVHGGSGCWHLESAKSDAKGDYQMPAWSREPLEPWESHSRLRDQRPQFMVYVEGFRAKRYIERENIIEMVPDQRPTRERLEAISRIRSTCGSGDGSILQLVRVLRAICTEMRIADEAFLPLPSRGNYTLIDQINVSLTYSLQAAKRTVIVPPELDHSKCSRDEAYE